MLRFQMDIAAADMRRRTIEGLAVPYGEVAEIEGRSYRFLPGSVELARTRTPLLVDHDRRGPVGVLAALERTDAGELARFRVDETAEGDTALVQAASGSRGALSVGAMVDQATERDGVIEVSAARAVEFSLVALGAFEAAQVTRVAASATEDPAEPAEPAESPAEPEPEPEPAEPEPEPAEPPAVHPDQTALPADPPAAESSPPSQEEPPMESHRIEAAAPPVIRTNAPGAPLELRAGELVGLMIRAQHGEQDAARYLEAALAESISTDVTGLLPPTYERTVIGGKEVNRPLYDAFRSRPLPGVGLLVSKPKWSTPPNGAWAATVDADATTSTVVIGSQTADVARWDWAGAIPWVVVQRSDPSIVDEIYGEAVQDFYLDVEAKIYAELSAAAVGVATSLGAAIAEFYTATGDRTAPEVIIMAPDVWGDFADTGALSVAMAQGAVGGDLSTSFAGIPAVTSGTLAAGETILATRRAVDARTTEPVRLTANAIGALNVELAVVGEGLFDTDYPAELLKFAAIIPQTAAQLEAARKSRSGSKS